MQDRRILVVEDEGIVAEDIRATLRGLGYCVPATAASGEEALQVASNSPPALALLDIRIQGKMDGIETADVLRERYGIPVVFLTSYSDEATLARAKEVEPHGYLLKPFNERELRAVIEMALYKHKMEQRVAVSERLAALGRMAAGIAHEINNPLAYVSANIEFVRSRLDDFGGYLSEGPIESSSLEDATRGVSEVVEALRDAADGAERVRRVVAGLRTFARVDGKSGSPCTRVEIALAAALKLTAHAMRHHARVQKDYGATPAIHLDEGLLVQLFAHLLINAAQAMKDGDVENNLLRIVTRTDARGRAVVEIHDTGPGMTREELALAFEPFYTTKGSGVGTGLGLPICQSVVSDIGGEISLESHVGRGTTARVALPPAALKSVPVRGAVAAVAAEAKGPGRKGRVLVIDDEAPLGTALARMLAGRHEVTIETEARAALERLSTDTNFDIILCDLMMPNMSGEDFYEALHAAAPLLAERVVFMTGGAFSPRAQAFLAKTQNLSITKPFSQEELRGVLARFVR